MYAKLIQVCLFLFCFFPFKWVIFHDIQEQDFYCSVKKHLNTSGVIQNYVSIVKMTNCFYIFAERDFSKCKFPPKLLCRKFI